MKPNLPSLALAMLLAVSSGPALPQTGDPIEWILQDFNRRQAREASPSAAPRIIQIDPGQGAKPKPKKKKAARSAAKTDGSLPRSSVATTIALGGATDPAAPASGPGFPFGGLGVSSASVPATATAPESSQPAPPAIVSVEHRVVVIGDSLGQLIADGLATQFQTRGDVEIKNAAKGSTGFVRDDFFDWNKAIDELVAGNPDIDAVVIAIGSNDRQPITDASGTYEVRSDGWRERYISRIDRALKSLRDAGMDVIFVGLPPMRAERMSADAVAFNEIYKERTERAGGTYVDLWDAFADEQGGFMSNGPDLNGQPAKLRSGDGVHFTKVGAQLAAHYVERVLVREFGETPSLANLLQQNSPIPGIGSLEPVIVPFERTAKSTAIARPEAVRKPEFGPVQPLEAYSAADQAVLLGGQSGPLAAGAAAVTFEGPRLATADPTVALVLDRGEALDSKPGRVDDFRWPRPEATSRPRLAAKQ